MGRLITEEVAPGCRMRAPMEAAAQLFAGEKKASFGSSSSSFLGFNTMEGAYQVGPTLTELAEGPYFVLAPWLDAATLCSTDAACRRLLVLNNATIGPWRAYGARAFHGLELQEEGRFEPESCAQADGRKLTRIHWKGRYQRFQNLLSSFCAPFGGSEISVVEQPDEVAYFRCLLCTDILTDPHKGIYLEVEVLQNPDNLSMAVVDFEAGGCSSVTFSPDTGAVIRERKVREAPRKVEGAYIQPLPTLSPGERFHGFLGLYLQGGNLAFFRRSVGSAAVLDRVNSGAGGSSVSSKWECTGFVSDLSWATGRRLTPCLAFRSEGAYQARIARICGQPPLHPEAWNSRVPPSALGWNGLDWEADPNDPTNGEG